ncbi:hypothetical protein D3H65_00430 [Paraflavitalea soli]|uniref:Uncharacterized protein n=1 Tax=Paraflavitalea soli TaxID=2315862 RepID=A0A3B7MHH9_9BACT|nr:hypothetical protein D3H65_00430 [Paraflavitalea soli]
MSYCTPADPMQNHVNYMPGYMYRLHIPWHFFNALATLIKILPNLYKPVIFKILCKCSPVMAQAGISFKDAECMPVGFL